MGICSTAKLSLRVGWFISQTAETGIAGLVAGSGLSGRRLGSLALKVVVMVVFLVVVTIVMQSFGASPEAQ